MSYTIDRTFSGETFDAIVERVRAALGAHGFGVLTEINVQDTLKAKIGAEIDSYLILGACNPTMANEAIKIEPRIGAMLPCNVVVRATPGDEVMVSAVDPVSSMQAIPNRDLHFLADQVRDMLKAVVDDI
ncbi:DUF302 domain-containing protein [Oricola sp.]|uniref:DUF302 domain-containing protein n=1 Tax=Oricola sp. TaxID=1979950 RepID=UPI0025DDD45B|nr:DUF302 domain-containing protein [Oricola sp.]MCI5076764.1 DUF302 domain-containing protein [Oricola sp.]